MHAANHCAMHRTAQHYTPTAVPTDICDRYIPPRESALQTTISPTTTHQPVTVLLAEAEERRGASGVCPRLIARTDLLLDPERQSHLAPTARRPPLIDSFQKSRSRSMGDTFQLDGVFLLRFTFKACLPSKDYLPIIIIKLSFPFLHYYALY